MLDCFINKSLLKNQLLAIVCLNRTAAKAVRSNSSSVHSVLTSSRSSSSKASSQFTIKQKFSHEILLLKHSQTDYFYSQTTLRTQYKQKIETTICCW